MGTDELAERAADYNRGHANQARSGVLRRIWQGAYGDDYPADADPYSFVTLSQLRRIAGALAVGPGQTIVDLGCGRGGSGLWVARETGASLTGIDLSTVAVEEATGRAAAFGLADRARFLVGSYADTGLPDLCCDGALSSDALFYGPDHGGVMREIARILRPGARLAFTSWEFDRWSPVLRTGPIADYRPFLMSAGFEVEAYEEAEAWEPRWRAVFAGLLARRDELAQELGEESASRLERWARERPAEAAFSRQVFAVARRP